MLVPAEVWTLAKTDQGNAVLIKPKGAEIAVPIFIGQSEAQSILIGLGEVEIQRPLTHDLLISTLRNLNTYVRRVEITDLSEGIFYGRLVVTKSGKEISIDARPSDCIAVAVRVKCNIYIDESVVDEAGISITIINEPGGEYPLDMSKKDSELSKLKKQLDVAVEEEDYEEAAKLRDKIKEIEGQS